MSFSPISDRLDAIPYDSVNCHSTRTFSTVRSGVYSFYNRCIRFFYDIQLTSSISYPSPVPFYIPRSAFWNVSHLTPVILEATAQYHNELFRGN